MALLLTAIVAGGLGWLIWWAFRGYVVKSCLDHIPGPPRTSFLTGNFGDMMRRDCWKFVDHLLESYSTTFKIHGLLGDKTLYTIDPIAVQSVLVKDNLSYEETDEFIVGNGLVLGPGLIATLGDVHRKQRKILGPSFSNTNLRAIAPIIDQVVERLCSAIKAQVKTSPEPVDMLNWMSRGALEMLGKGGLGYSFDPLESPAHNPYGDAVKALLPTMFAFALHWLFVSWTPYLGTPQFRRWLLDMYPHRTAQKLRGISDLMWRNAVRIVDEKKAALEKGEGLDDDEGKDIMSVLLKANMNASAQDRLSDDQVIGQVNTFVLAGTDTTSNIMSRILDVLSIRQDMQDRLRSEVMKARAELGASELSFDTVMEMPLLDAVCKESFRLYPPVLAIDRVVQKDTVLPLANPINDVHGNPVYKIPLTKGTGVTFSIYGYHRSKDIWGEDALEWKPDRWLVPLPETARMFPGGTPFANLMNFALGHRSCIGYRYAELEMKITLFRLMESFKFSSAGVDIYWNASHVVFPSLTKDSPAGSMPLKVQFIKA
ncbi:cytochrome P450-dit2 [Steccherinum ochraceum]|uniref:Cytochrome P450-dit2 n=1 Tax=Steccherinum ochraceum TaxID=92696 RepID=A0A4R0R523_9APHY|nr:cytochrome P450-dit2 [Steccherinum ochraceum]